jgi:hypothetical protein
MGLTYSTPQTDRVTVNKFENVSKLVELNLNENEDLLDSLNITELNRANIKEPLPIIGGNYDDSDSNNDNNSLYGGNRYNYYDDDDSDNNYRNTKFISSKNRFNKYDLFKVINELENKKKVNRNLRGGNLEEDLSKSISNDDAMEQVQKIILKELDKVSNTNMTGGGDCGCDGSKNFSGGAKKNNAKGKKNNKKLFGGSSSEKVKLESTQSEENSSSSSSSSSSTEETSNGENREDGLSIFPMNSSDINSSSAEKALRMTRRRI